MTSLVPKIKDKLDNERSFKLTIAFKDLMYTTVAHVLLDGCGLDITIATVHLYCLITYLIEESSMISNSYYRSIRTSKHASVANNFAMAHRGTVSFDC